MSHTVRRQADQSVQMPAMRCVDKGFVRERLVSATLVDGRCVGEG